jgi:GNAT superfamily N-acetyltransferase
MATAEEDPGPLQPEPGKHGVMPRSAAGWWAIVLSVVGLGSWIVLPLITINFRDTFPITDTALMPIIGLVLVDLLGRFDPDSDGLWTAQVDGRVEGPVVVDGSHGGAEGAHLRWFLVGDALPGCGAGSQLLREALAFCRGRGFGSVYLWTFAGLDAARRLYEASGCVLTEEHLGMRWGTEVMEQRMECDLRHTS